MVTNLLIHNFVFLLTGFINITLAFFVFLYGRKKMTHILGSFSLFCLAVSVFQISQALGTIAPDPVTSRIVFMFNLTDIFIGIFWTHWFLSLIGKLKEQLKVLISIYASGIVLFIFYLLYPHQFLIDSVPKMYFPYYYEPGPLYIVMVAWFFLIAVYYFYQMTRAYIAERDPVQKNRFKYVLASMLYAFLGGTTAFALVFDIHIDPVISAFGGFYTIVLAYAIIEYELLDIRILAKRAFMYAVVMVLAGVVIFTTNFAGDFLAEAIPGFPEWLAPLVIAILVSSGGIYVWRKKREADIEKYEFISVIMHKFRTPLTKVKWASEVVAAEKNSLSPDGQIALNMIERANTSIVDLTNVLVSLNDTDKRSYSYNFKAFGLLAITAPLIEEYRPRFSEKKISLELNVPDGVKTEVYSDPSKIKFAFDILINNAYQYTPIGGKVVVSITSKENIVFWNITDNGIGISKENSSLIFSKFYRGENARHTSTEGTGIGLYLAHEIIRRGGGRISFSSPGESRGTTFTVSLPTRI